MKLRYLAGVAGLAVLAAASAQAQDPDAAPAYGSTSLSAGFAEDPTSIGVRAGGAINANNMIEECYGYVTHQPSYVLNYEAGSLPLYLSAASDVDTVLMVAAPDGSWHCNDDAWSDTGPDMGLNPGVAFDDPQSGAYRIWVGTFGSGNGYEPAMLHISELGFSADNIYSRAPRASLAPSAATVSLRGGFGNDPRTIPVSAGGDLDFSNYTSCWGHAGEAPDVIVNYQADGADYFYVSMEADGDTTLAVQGPDGGWICDDDSAGDLNPGIRIDDPADGRYAIWTARYSSGAPTDATLYLSNVGFLGEIDEPPVLDYSLPSSDGSVTLDAGFAPDPYSARVTAGGGVDIYEAVGDMCRGYADTEPDFDLTYEAGMELDLYISATSDSDATLVVNAPDGSWWCDDDSAGDLNPGIRFDAPQSGRYDIWVGTYGEYDGGPATLHISELGFGEGFGGGTPLDWSLEANYGGTSLSSGFANDPVIVDLVAGGPLDAENAADQSCRGYVTEAPDYELSYEAGSDPLYISALSDSDTTLVINAPDGSWVCNDDGAGNLNPGVHFDAPQSGTYDIWVGTYWDGEGADAQLVISADGFAESD